MLTSVRRRTGWAIDAARSALLASAALLADRRLPTKSSMKSLQPSRSPQNATLEPITGPRSSRTGACLFARASRRTWERPWRRGRLVTGRRRIAGARSVRAFAAPLEEMVSIERTTRRVKAGARGLRRPGGARDSWRERGSCVTAGSCYREAAAGVGWVGPVAALLGLGFGGLVLGWLVLPDLLSPGLVRPACRRRAACRRCRGNARLGNGDARRRDVAVDRTVVTNVHLLGGGHVPVTSPRMIDRLREHLSFDLAVGADRQDVLAKFDLPFDLPLDGEIFAAAQLALDDYRFADIHGLLLSARCVDA